MNKTRIDELIGQVIDENLGGEVTSLNLERMAELVALECVQVCLGQRDPQNLNYKPSEHFAEEIRKHFGIKS